MRLLTDVIPSTLVYLLAHIRRGPYYIEVASDLEAIQRRALTLGKKRRVDPEIVYDPSLLVWHEACGSEEAARARVAEIGCMPLPWQRRLIEAQNPHWLEQDRILSGLPAEAWYAIPETTPKVRPRLDAAHLSQETISHIEAQARQWREAIAARTPAAPMKQRHRTPVYAGRVSPGKVRNDLWAHGMVVLDLPPAAVAAFAQDVNRHLIRVDPDVIGFVFYTALDVPGHGPMQYCVCHTDIDTSNMVVEHALVVAATRAWVAAGKPARYVADLEVDVSTRTAYAAAAGKAGRGARPMAEAQSNRSDAWGRRSAPLRRFPGNGGTFVSRHRQAPLEVQTASYTMLLRQIPELCTRARLAIWRHNLRQAYRVTPDARSCRRWSSAAPGGIPRSWAVCSRSGSRGRGP